MSATDSEIHRCPVAPPTGRNRQYRMVAADSAAGCHRRDTGWHVGGSAHIVPTELDAPPTNTGSGSRTPSINMSSAAFGTWVRTGFGGQRSLNHGDLAIWATAIGEEFWPRYSRPSWNR